VNVIGIGLPRTGTRSLAEACALLGMRSIHYSPHLRHLPAWPRVFDGVDAAWDYPCSGWWRQVTGAYPDARVVLTVRRSVPAWVASMRRHIEACRGKEDFGRLQSEAVHTCLFGEAHPSDETLAAAYVRHTGEVLATIDPDRLLVFAVDRGDGWRDLCGFLGCSIPETDFPWLNRSSNEPDSPPSGPVQN
jgi:hypothetical protein